MPLLSGDSLIASVYRTQPVGPSAPNPRHIDTYSDNFRYYSYARYSLRAALIGLGLKPGDGVLLPGFICRDFLSGIQSLGGKPLFYSVTPTLEPSEDLLHVAQQNREILKAVILVNYFGFPQTLEPFEELARSFENLALIEDNAHGYLSETENGVPLGTRCEFGLLSFRKTVSVLNGAALYMRNPSVYAHVQSEAFDEGPLPRSFQVKQIMRKGMVSKKCDPWIVASLTKVARLAKKFKTPPLDIDVEREPPFPKSPYSGLLAKLAFADEEFEKTRRRGLYELCYDLLKNSTEPVYSHLPRGTAPFVYPFRIKKGAEPVVHSLLAAHCLECFSWPDLPHELVRQVPDYYLDVWCVRFLW